MADIETTKILNIDTSKAQKNVSDLTNKVNQLDNATDAVQKGGMSVGEAFQNVAKVGATFSATIGGITAGMQLLGVENKDVIEQMQKLQQVQAITSAFDQIANNGVTAFKALKEGVSGVTKSTKGLKAALAGTGIGLLVIAVGVLIENWDSLTAAFGKFNDKTNIVNKSVAGLSAAFAAIKATVIAVGKTIYNYFVTPFESIINMVKAFNETEGSLLDKLKAAGKAAKETVVENVKEVKEGYEKIGEETANAYNKKLDEKNAEAKAKRDKEAAEARKKELEEKQKAWEKERQELEKHLAAEKTLEESKHADDWKYTEEGKKYYEDYFNKRLSWYSKDSDEYKNILAEKNKFDRDYSDKFAEEQEKQTEAARAAAEEQRKIKEAELSEIDKINNELRRKNQTDEQNALEDLEAKYEEQKALFEKHQVDTTALTEQYEKERAAIKEEYNPTTKGPTDEEVLNSQIDASQQALDVVAAYADSVAEDIGGAFGAAFSGINSVIESTQGAMVKFGDSSASAADKATASAQVAAAAFSAASSVLSSLADEQDKTSKEGFEKSKKYQIAAATMNMLSGMVTAFSTAFQLGPIAGPIVGAALATAVGVMGAIQISKIKQQQFSGSSSSSSASVPSVSTSSVSDLSNNTINTRSVQGDSETSYDNKVYVTETDITSTTSKVKTQVSENSI